MDGITVTAKTIAPTVSQETPEEAAAASATVDGKASSHLDAIERLEFAQMLDVRDVKDYRLEYVLDNLLRDHHSKGEVYKAIRGIELKIGAPRYGHGETRLKLVYTYLRTQQAFEDAKAGYAR